MLPPSPPVQWQAISRDILLLCLIVLPHSFWLHLPAYDCADQRGDGHRYLLLLIRAYSHRDSLNNYNCNRNRRYNFCQKEASDVDRTIQHLFEHPGSTIL
ncbi:hypothetical protein VTO58DRAFT_102263 [Aureobasidium pullulans]